MFTKGLN